MIDLHSHSTASDGTYTPSQVAVAAYEKHLLGIALTDHDTVAGIPEFLEMASHLPGLAAIPGLELSTNNLDGVRMHVLGLGIDCHAPSLQDLTSQNQKWRDERNSEMIAKLQEMGYGITEELAKSFCHDGGVLGRPHLADALVALGICQDQQEAFRRFLKEGSPAYVRRQVFPVDVCIEKIHQAGGVAVWAHPFSRALTCAKFQSLALQLQEMGLDGLEAYHPKHTAANTDNVLSVAKKLNLLCTGGSDCHGYRFDKQCLGDGDGTLRVPDRLLTILLERIHARTA